MRIIGIIVFIVILISVYLNLTYAAFFNNIKKADLKSPINANEMHIVDPKRPTDKTVIFLGDSLTAGVGAKSEQNLLAVKVRQIYFSSENVYLINSGNPGARVSDLIVISENLKSHNTDLTVIFIGINDLFNRTSLDLFKQDLSSTVQNMKANSKRVVLLTIPFLGTSQSVPVPFDSIYNYQLNRYNSVIKDVGHVLNVETIDLYTLTQGKLTDPKFFAEDYFHPSDEGYKVLADIIANELKK